MPESSPSYTFVVKHSCFYHSSVCCMCLSWTWQQYGLEWTVTKTKEMSYSIICAPDIAPSLVNSNGSVFHYLLKHRNIHSIISIKIKETRSPCFHLVHKLAKMSHSYLSASYFVTKRNDPGRSDRYLVPRFNCYFLMSCSRILCYQSYHWLCSTLQYRVSTCCVCASMHYIWVTKAVKQLATLLRILCIQASILGSEVAPKPNFILVLLTTSS